MDLLRVVAVVLVVVEHAVILPRVHVPGPLWALGGFFQPFRIPALMLLSGMLLGRSSSKPPGQYLWGKVARLLWPFLVWTGVHLAVYRGTGFLPAAGAEQFVVSSGPLFYLQYLFLFFLLAWVVPPRVRSAVVLPVLVVAALVPTPEAQRFLYLMAFFLLGDLLSRRPRVLEALASSRPVVCASLLVAVGTGLAAVAGLAVRYNPCWAVGAAAGILCLVVLCRRVARTPVGGRFSLLGAQTVVVYVVSWPVQIVLSAALDRMGLGQPALLVALLVIGGLSAGLGLGWLRGRSRWVDLLFQLGVPRRGAAREPRT